jgi:hypothetical protein
MQRVGLLKKRKKAKKSHSPESTPNSAEQTATAKISKVPHKVVESAASAVPIAVATAEVGA